MLARVPKRSTGKKPENLVRIRTKGGKEFEVEEKIACMFARIKSTLDSEYDPTAHSLSLLSLSDSASTCSTSSSNHTACSVVTSTSSCHSTSCCSATLDSHGGGGPGSAPPVRNPQNPTGLTCVKGPDGEIVLEKTRGGIFALMIRWAMHHRRDPLVTQFRSHDHTPLAELPLYDQKFFAKLTRSQLFEMLQNSSYLQVPLLTEMLAKTIANQLRGKSIEDIRSEFGITCDYTPEEEAAIKEDTERFLRRLRGDCDTDGEDGADMVGEGALVAATHPHAALLNKCESEMTESERIAFAQNILPLLSTLQQFSS